MLGKREILVFIKRDTMEVYLPGVEGTLGRLEFPPDVYRAEEIISEDKFKKMLADFVAKVAAGASKATIAIAEEAVFFKEVKASEVKDQKKEAESFFSEVPFDVENLAKKVIKKGETVVFLATNKKVFSCVVETLGEIGIQVEVVLPANLFVVSGASVLTKEQVKKLMERNDASGEANLFESIGANQKASGNIKSTSEVDQSNETVEEDKTEKNNEVKEISGQKTKIFILLFVFILLLGVLGFLIYKKFDLVNRFLSFDRSKKESVVLNSPVPATFSAQATSSAQSINTTLKINILNGTGIAGQAALVKGKLLSEGFQNIEVGNSLGSNSASTVMIFKDSVNSETRNKIKDVLNGLYSNVKESTLSADSAFDVEIVTGEPK